MTRPPESYPAAAPRQYRGIDPRVIPAHANLQSPAAPPKGGGLRRVLFLVVSLIGVVILIAGGFYAANMFLAASSPEPATRAPENTEVIFSGRAADLKAAPGNTVQQDDTDASTVWVRSQVRTAKSSGSTDGVSLSVPAEILQKIRGKRIRVTVSAAGNAASPFAVAYSAGTANSGWVVFQPTGKFQDFSLNFVVPRSADAANYIGIWSDIDGRGTPLAIRRVAITVLSNAGG